MKKTCDITNIVLSDNVIDYVHKTKYLGVLLCSDTRISIDVCRQTSKFYAQVNTLLRHFRYCSDDVKCMLFCSFCTNMHYSPLWFNSTLSSIKQVKIFIVVHYVDYSTFCFKNLVNSITTFCFKNPVNSIAPQ